MVFTIPTMAKVAGLQGPRNMQDLSNLPPSMYGLRAAN